MAEDKMTILHPSRKIRLNTLVIDSLRPLQAYFPITPSPKGREEKKKKKRKASPSFKAIDYYISLVYPISFISFIFTIYN
jgi:hypothetical protein